MADRLYINGEVVDMAENTQAGVTVAVNDLGDMSSRQGSFSSTIKLPQTDRNKRVLEFIHSIVSGSLLPYTKARADYYTGSTQLVGDGVATIQEVGKTIDINLFSGNSSFFSAIDGLKLSDLNLSAYDLAWNHSGVVAAYGNPQTPITLLIDDGSLSDTVRTINTKTMYFNAYLKDLIRAMFDDAGYVFSGDVFADANYIKQVLIFALEHPRQGLTEIEESKTKVYGRGAEAYTTTQSGTNKIYWVDESPGYDLNNNFDTNTGNYTVPHGGKINVKGRLVVDDIWNGTPVVFQTNVRMYVNGVHVETYSGFSSTDVKENEVNYIDFTISHVVEQGDVIEIYFNWVQLSSNAHSFACVDGAITSAGRTWIQFDLDEELQWGNVWHMERNLPDWTQKDLLKLFVTAFGQSFQVDDFAKEVKFFSVDDVVANKGTQYSDDWSAYFEHGTAGWKFHSTYNQINDCIFLKDDEVTEFTGNSSFTIQDETLKPRGEAMKLPYAASINVRKMGGLDMAEVLRTDIEGNDVTPKPRLLTFVSTSFPSPNTSDYIRLYEDGTANQNDFYVSYSGQFLLDFETILDLYYTAWIEILQNYKAVAGTFLLPSHVVANIDFTRPKYINKLSSWFYVNKIDNYSSGKKCRVELIQV